MTARAFTRWDMVKLVALALMFIDHAGFFFYDNASHEWIRGIGRACAPMFFFLAGFAPHYKRADIMLWVLALVLTAVDWSMRGAAGTLNILWTILIIRALLYWLESRDMFNLKLHEWVIGIVVILLPTVVLLQYGSMGLLIALCGYVYKHRAHYNAHTPARFLWFSTLLYGAVFVLLSSFSLLTAAVIAISFTGMNLLLIWFTNAPLSIINAPRPLIYAGKTCARYTAPIYAGHLIVLIMLTGKPL